MSKFHLLNSDGMTHIDGHKHPSADHEIITYNPEKVYIQAVDNKGMPLTEMLPVGTEVKVGTKLGVRSDFGLPVYSSVSGKIVAMENKLSAWLGRPAQFFVIENDKKYDEVFLEKLCENPTKEDVVNKLKEGAIIGLGGAGFPTFIKYNLRPDVKVDTILVNAIECEPYLTTDYVEGARAVEDMFYALPILLDAVEAKQAIIAVKKNKPLLIDAVKNAIASHPELNGRVSLSLVPDRYPMGFERTLIREVLKREYNMLPSECGVIENNIQTLEFVGRLFREGKVISRRVITISGEGVALQSNVDIPVGTLLGDIVRNNGGYALEEIKIINGGPMCGKTVLNDELPVLPQCGGFTIKEKYNITPEPCWKCGKCTDHCPMGLQPVLIQMALNRKDVQECHDLQAEKCVECGLCSFVCPSHIDVSANVAKAKMMCRIQIKPGTLTDREKQKQKNKEKMAKFLGIFKKKPKEEQEANTNEEVKK